MKRHRWLLPMLVGMIWSVALFGEDVVTVKSEPVTLPTYTIGPPDLNAIYFTGRVYQGAQGHTYPYAMYDILTDNKVDVKYNGLFLENQYLQICVLPEMGGRILQATDKTNRYEFFYRQHVVKPALIGMIGAWMSGGVEWNIPHHHRPSSFMAVDWKTTENKDGSKTIHVGETELRHRMKWNVAMTVRPGRSYLEAKVRIANRSDLLQSMLSWANVSVHCDENYEVIFPPSVQHGTDHAKIKFCDWPIHNGVDYRFWKNHTDQFRSVFAWDFEKDFLAGYDHGKEAGTVHFANHHIVTGKKFFLWGNHDRAKMWDQMLTDEDGCYLELMVGAWSDNQPDYSWIGPGTVREFSHYWYPIKGIRGVKNATLDAAVNLERTAKDKVFFGFCVTGTFDDATVELTHAGQSVLQETISLTPENAYLKEIAIPEDAKDSDLCVSLRDKDGNLLVKYQPQVLEPEPEPEIVKPTGDPKDFQTVEELYLAGLRIEQFHNARMDPMVYYGEALRRDPGDARTNTVVGLRYARQGKWDLAEKHLTLALERLTHNYTVVKDGEPHYVLGYVQWQQGRLKEAKDQFWKAAWTTGYEAAAYMQLARIACAEGAYAEAVKLADASLHVNDQNTKAMVIQAFALRKLGKSKEAGDVLNQAMKRDKLDHWATVERAMLKGTNAKKLAGVLRRNLVGDAMIQLQELLEMVVDYRNMGAMDEAKALLEGAIAAGKPYANSPMVYYYLGDYETAAKQSPDYCFPFRVEELALLETVLKAAPGDAWAWLYYGDLLYYLEQKEKGVAAWEKSAELNPKYGRVWRNLGFAYNRAGDVNKAIAAYKKSLQADPTDPRVYTELDVLEAQLFVPAADRLAVMEANLATVLKHDDAVIRLVGLYNETGNYQKSIDLMAKRHFHVWEGGRAVHDNFVDAHLLRGLALRDAKQFDEAVKDFEIAQTYPANLEVGRVVGGGQNAKIFHFLGTTLEAKGDREGADKAFAMSAARENRPGDLAHELTYYQIQSLRKLGKTEEAEALTKEFASAVTARLNRDNRSDEFSKFGEDGTPAERQAKLLYLQGMVQLAGGDHAAANTFFDEALKRNPNMIWPKIMKNEK
ncbi:MAG: DUF5107 domain-containing protein [Planctomycetia bacterium]|nr:DUF5107 domain-containing protein [Planctomycetia bacterium]